MIMGKLHVIEGTTGAGKSTLMIEKLLEMQDKHVVVFCGDDAIVHHLRRIGRGELTERKIGLHHHVQIQRATSLEGILEKFFRWGFVPSTIMIDSILIEEDHLMFFRVLAELAKCDIWVTHTINSASGRKILREYEYVF